ncbi:MAG TPA: O-acetyl-ADP-ribose deacetylase [Pseudomonadales bacterium]|nr:O-acetyl-ADP-ribose deacetylase [Pseudomonadales bacterium]
MARLHIIEEDITRLRVDAIVNAANSRLEPGGGVDGAIHDAAGPALAAACARIGGCPTGSARLTPAFDLGARWVIHAVGPIWKGGESGERDHLAGCYRSALALAAAEGARSIAFPAIATGIYGYPLAAATQVAVGTVRAALGAAPGIEDVFFCCFDPDTRLAYETELQAQARGAEAQSPAVSA